MKVSRRSVMAMTMAAAMVPAGAAHAQDAWPSRPIRFLVPWPAGGLNDLIARAFNDRVSKSLGQTIVTDFKAGMHRVRTLPAYGPPAILEMLDGGGARDIAFRCGSMVHPQYARISAPKAIPFRNETSAPLVVVVERLERGHELARAGTDWKSTEPGIWETFTVQATACTNLVPCVTGWASRTVCSSPWLYYVAAQGTAGAQCAAGVTVGTTGDTLSGVLPCG